MIEACQRRHAGQQRRVASHTRARRQCCTVRYIKCDLRLNELELKNSKIFRVHPPRARSRRDSGAAPSAAAPARLIARLDGLDATSRTGMEHRLLPIGIDAAGRTEPPEAVDQWVSTSSTADGAGGAWGGLVRALERPLLPASVPRLARLALVVVGLLLATRGAVVVLGYERDRDYGAPPPFSTLSHVCPATRRVLCLLSAALCLLLLSPSRRCRLFALRRQRGRARSACAPSRRPITRATPPARGPLRVLAAGNRDGTWHVCRQ